MISGTIYGVSRKRVLFKATRHISKMHSGSETIMTAPGKNSARRSRLIAPPSLPPPPCFAFAAFKLCRSSRANQASLLSTLKSVLNEAAGSQAVLYLTNIFLTS